MAIIIHQYPSKMWSGAILAKLIQRTTAVLSPLEKMSGVKSAFVLDNHGTVLGSFTDPTIDQSQLVEIGRYFAQVVAVFELHKSRPKEFECRFQNMNLLIRDIGNGIVAVAYAQSVSLSLLRMEINVAVAPFEKDLELQSQLKKAAPSCADTLTVEYLNADSVRWLGNIKQTA